MQYQVHAVRLLEKSTPKPREGVLRLGQRYTPLWRRRVCLLFRPWCSFGASVKMGLPCTALGPASPLLWVEWSRQLRGQVYLDNVGMERSVSIVTVPGRILDRCQFEPDPPFCVAVRSLWICNGGANVVRRRWTSGQDRGTKSNGTNDRTCSPTTASCILNTMTVDIASLGFGQPLPLFSSPCFQCRY